MGECLKIHERKIEINKRIDSAQDDPALAKLVRALSSASRISKNCLLLESAVLL